MKSITDIIIAIAFGGGDRGRTIVHKPVHFSFSSPNHCFYAKQSIYQKPFAEISTTFGRFPCMK